MTSEQKNQLHDRAQFRRYAEAAGGGMDHSSLSYEGTADLVFRQATEMMLREGSWFEQYQLEATQMMIDEERKRQGIEPPYADPS